MNILVHASFFIWVSLGCIENTLGSPPRFFELQVHSSSSCCVLAAKGSQLLTASWECPHPGSYKLSPCIGQPIANDWWIWGGAKSGPLASRQIRSAMLLMLQTSPQDQIEANLQLRTHHYLTFPPTLSACPSLFTWEPSLNKSPAPESQALLRGPNLGQAHTKAELLGLILKFTVSKFLSKVVVPIYIPTSSL